VESHQPVQIDNALNAKIKSLGTYGEVLVDIAPRLPGVIRGEIDRLELLLQKDRLYRLYEPESHYTCYERLVKCIKLLQFKNPNLRILEIGAGTASTWMPILEALYSNSDGFELGSYDLIIASNVLHATGDINTTLRNVRDLLKLNGELALMEATALKIHSAVIFGMLPGWWLGNTDNRVESPLLDISGWHDRLRRCGFSGINFEMHDYDSVGDYQMSVIISSATSHPGPLPLSRRNLMGRMSTASEVSTAECATSGLKAGFSTYPKLLTDLIGDSPQTIIVVSGSEENNRIAGHVADLLPSVKPSIHVKKTLLAEAEMSEDQLVVVVLEVSLIVGLTRCLRSEDLSAKVVTLDLELNHGSGLQVAGKIIGMLDHAFGLSAPQTSALLELEYANKQGIKSRRALTLRTHEPGLLDSHYWAGSGRHSQRVGAEEVRVELQYVSLNFKDIMVAMGQLGGYTAMLLEGSRKVVELGQALHDQYAVGNSVYVTHWDGLAMTSVIDPWNVRHFPKTIPIEVATAIPTAYTTVLYSLRNVANLQEGETSLIHSGAGAVGQAAISIAQYLKAGAIFVTVGNAKKRTLVREQFQIPNENIFSSRDLGFFDQILRQTKYHGVNVVLNSLSEDVLQRSCSLLAPFGRFVEIGKKDIISNVRLKIGCLERSVSFTTVDLTLLAKRKPAFHQELYRSVFDLANKQKIKVLSPLTINGLSELEASFRMMQAGKHMGRLLLNLDPEMTFPVQPQKPPAPKLKGDCSYLEMGGTGGLGGLIIKHLASLGAKHIVTLSRSGPHGSVMDTVAFETIKDQAREFPIRGIIQGAMVLQHDSLMDNVSYEQWQAAMESKVMGTMNLHQVFGDTLDVFIFLSSLAGTIGSYAQGNYCAGNIFQDSLARHRASLGLPARSIDVGAVEGDSHTVENQDTIDFVIGQGLQSYKAEEFLATINEAIHNPLASSSFGGAAGLRHKPN
ncbi:hypothetical protein APSETT445_009706, partial [Aspergillus pseudonomiae]